MEDLRLIFDARPLTLYPMGKPGFTGGTEAVVHRLAAAMAKRGHEVHVITNDLQYEEHRGPNLWYWPKDNHPVVADIAIPIAHLETVGDLSAPLMVLLSNGIDPELAGHGDYVDAFVTFTEAHSKLLAERSSIPLEKCFVTGLGIDVKEMSVKATPVYGRLLWANDPSRGLWHMLDIFDHVKQAIPEATLHVSYNFDRQLYFHQWNANAIAEIMWKCKDRLENTPGVTNMGNLSHEDLLSEQMECHVQVFPSDPQNVGSQLHGLTQMEMCALGVPLITTEIEAFPELYADCATFLPWPGQFEKYDKKRGEMRRVTAKDWADEAVYLMKHPRKWATASRKAKMVAKRHDWSTMYDNYEILFQQLAVKVRDAARIAA